MGVHGLWRLIEPSGKPVPLETLENKILAVDVSIWLHQAIKGFQDSKGAPLPNAHLLGIYHRVCKLLYFRVKPVFVFDGGVPLLKKQTIAKRYKQKSKNLHDASDIQAKLLKTLLKHSAVSKVIADKVISQQENRPENDNTKDNMFILPEKTAAELDSTLDSESSTDESSATSPAKQWDLHTIDEKSEHFKSLPANVRHEILTDLMATRKQSSWGRIHEIPTESNDFSSFQMKRLLKRFSVQTSLDEAVQEMGGHSLSLGELETLLNAEGIVTDSQTTTGKRIASNEETRYLLIKDLQKAIENVKKEEEKRKLKELQITEENRDEISPNDKEFQNDLDAAVQLSLQDQPSTSNELNFNEKQIEMTSLEHEKISSNDIEFDRDLAAAIQLSLQGHPSTSKDTNTQELSFFDNFNDGDFDSDSETDEVTTITKLQQAKSYMIEYSGLTPNEIDKIINANKQKPNPCKKQTLTHQKLSENREKLVSNDLELNKKDKNLEIIEIDGTKNKILIEQKSIEIKSDSEKDSFKVQGNIHLNEENNSINQNNSIEIMSDSDDSDLIEVNISEPRNLDNKITKSSLQIVFNLKDKVEDDIFSDIFTENKIELKIKDIENKSENIKDSNLVANETKSDVDDKQENKISEVIEINEDLATTEMAKNVENKQIVPQNKSELKIKDIENKSGNIKDSNLVTNETRSDIDDKHENKISEIIEINENLETIETAQNVQNKQIVPQKPLLTIEELNKMKSDLIAEEQELIFERNTKKRIAGNITDQMYQEAQELLEFFGVPYIVAPMEAEAQCAFLNEIDLTDGTITDDSDIWLFGGKTVYKNFFNTNKHVLEFRAESIEHHFKLSREQLILLALLVGSDYTVGIQGIGPVTALEILAAFPPSRHTNISVLTQAELTSGLKDFTKWLYDGKAIGVARTSLRSKLKNVSITKGFPNLQVVQAYLEPLVETCADKFTWSKPDIVSLIDFAKEKFGWTKLKSEEILKPVIKKMEDKNIQKTIRDYFATQHQVDANLAESKMSKRVKTAVKKMSSKNMADSDEEKTTETKTTKRTKKDGGPSTAKITKKSKKEEESNACNHENKETIDKPSTRKSKIDYKNLGTINKNNPHPASVAAKQRVKAKRKEQLHTKECIPQKERDKKDALKTKLKAIEVFRKSKEGPGFMKKRPKVVIPLKDDAGLSENSSDE